MKKAMNAGLQGGVFEWEHIMRMGGSAMGLFGWCVLRQTRRNGLVLGGKILTYEGITADLRAPAGKVRTIKRWMSVLVSERYIDVRRAANQGIIITILNPKKHGSYQLGLAFDSAKNRTDELDDSAKKRTLTVRKSALSYTKNRTCIYIEPVKGATNETPEQEIAASPLIPAPPRQWIPLDAWLAFTRMLRKRNRMLTDDAIDLHIRDLERLRDQGNDPRDVLELAVKKNWNGLYAVEKERSNGRSREDEKHERSQRAIENVIGHRSGLADRLRQGLSGANNRGVSSSLSAITERHRAANPAQSFSARDEVIEVSADTG